MNVVDNGQQQQQRIIASRRRGERTGLAGAGFCRKKKTEGWLRTVVVTD